MILKIILLYLLHACNTVANARVYYIDDSYNLAQKSDGINYENPNNFVEQSSRDLDLSFSTGDTSSNDDNYPRENYPILKRLNPVRPYGTVEKQYSEINKETVRPRAYKLIEVPDRRSKFEEFYAEPKNNAEFTKSNSGNRKGGVILELRVITNNDV